MSEEPISIAVDVMGGDYAPGAIIEGVGLALDVYGNAFRLLLVGDRPRMEEELKRIGKLGDGRLELIHSSQVVEMGEHPIAAVRHKRDSSINVAVDLVKDGKAVGVFSAGNTGAAVGSAYFHLKMLEGVERPGIAAIIPSETGHFLVMDAGASVDCDAENLLQYALMGAIYSNRVLKVENPRVALLCNGTEDGKGNRLTQSAFQRMQKVHGINFIGNCEGHDLFSGKVDVVVCDGFVGNVLLKSSEQLAKSMGHMLKRFLMGTSMRKLGALLAKGAFNELKQVMDPSEYGGAPLLGVNGVVIIGHGISDAKAVCNGIKAVAEAHRQNLNGAIAEQVARQKQQETAPEWLQPESSAR